MMELNLHIQDRKDLLILWNALNNAQSHGRMNLANQITKSKRIENDWLHEAIDEWDRVMGLKTQIEKELVKKG
jgi:hypothetical protein